MIADESAKNIVVLGLGPAGLFVSRQLSKFGKNVIGIGKHDDIGRYSNALSKCYIADNADELYHAIKEISLSLQHKAEALICSDGYLTFIIEDYPEVFDLLIFSSPEEKTLRLIHNKEQLSEQMKCLNLRTPKIYDPSLHEIEFPVIVKPIIKRKVSNIPKISYIHKHNELCQLIDKALEHGLEPNDLLIQQLIEGTNDNEFGYGGYFECGDIINDVAFIQARQYPQGVSCTAIEISDKSIIDELRNLTIPLIHSLNYTGFIQFDIKKSASTGEYYILDVNPRPWGSISIMTPKGANKNGNLFIHSDNQERNAFWHFPLKELMSVKNRRNISFKKCRSMMSPRKEPIIDLWDKNDFKPFFMQWLVSLVKLFGK